MLFYFNFVLANVDADQTLGVDRATAITAMNWALLIAAIYWVNGLLTRSIVIRLEQPLVANLGYNSKEVTLLSAAVLIGRAVVAVRQTPGLPASAWTVMGPLLALRTITDLFARLRRPSRWDARIPDPSMGLR